MKKEFRSLINGLDRELREISEKPTTKITIFLLGPGDSDASNGKSLRKYLQKKCDEIGVTVIGEHKELIEIFNRRTEGLSNLCVMEKWFAIRHANAVIIIPYSAGSLVELGMFTSESEVCRKTMLLFSAEFPENDDSFINKGPKIDYKEKGACVTFVDYEKKRRVWREVKEFLLKYKGKKFEQELLKKHD